MKRFVFYAKVTLVVVSVAPVWSFAAGESAIAEDRAAHQSPVDRPSQARRPLKQAPFREETAADFGLAEDRTPPLVGLLFIAAVLVALIGFALAIPALAWRRKREAKSAIAQLHWSGGAKSCEPSQLHPLRILPVNPFLETASAASLQQQIEVAATASVRYGRTFGLIYFKIRGRQGGAGARLTWSDDEKLHVLDRFRRVLRCTDHVTLLNETEIIICISLLPGLPELEKKSRRVCNGTANLTGHGRFAGNGGS